jgi:hypothetical protein
MYSKLSFFQQKPVQHIPQADDEKKPVLAAPTHDDKLDEYVKNNLQHKHVLRDDILQYLSETYGKKKLDVVRAMLHEKHPQYKLAETTNMVSGKQKKKYMIVNA